MGDGRKILLVDDEPSVLRVGRRMLEALGHEVVPVSSGAEAVEGFSREPESIVCVILDLTMPDMDGKEVLSHLRRSGPDVPVVIASGYSSEQVFERLGGASVSDTIEKPFRLQELSAVLDRVLG
jgi:CheY-like chemotaxis protein